MSEQSESGQSHENIPPQDTRAVELLKRLPADATSADIQELQQKLRELPVTVVRTGGMVESDWHIVGLSHTINSATEQGVVWVHKDENDGDTDMPGVTKGIELDEFFSWHTPDGLRRAIQMETVDWNQVPAIEGTQGTLSVKELEDLRTQLLSPTALGVKNPEQFSLAREKRAQELVDVLLPVDRAPSDQQQAARYARQRDILKEDLIIGEDAFRRHKRMWFDRYYDSNSDEEIVADTALSTTERRQYRESVNALRHEYAERLAKRSRSMTEAVWTNRDIGRAREELADVIGAEATQMFEEGVERGIDKQVLVEQIDAFVKQQTDMLLADMEASRIADASQHNRFVRWGLEQWAALGGPEQMKLSLKEKIRTKEFWLRTGVLGGISAVLGGAAVLTAGFAGAGAAAVFGAGLLTRTIARNMAGMKLDSAANQVTIAKTQHDEQAQDVDAIWAASQQTTDHTDKLRMSHADLLTYVDKQSESLRKTNTKKLMGNIGIGLAFGLAGAGVATAVQSALPHMTDFFGSRGHSGQVEPSATPSDTGSSPSPTTESSPKPTLPTIEEPQIPSKPPLPTIDSGGTSQVNQATDGEIKEFLSNHAAARRIDGGEGWLQTFKELGMSPSERRAFLEQYGDDLLKKFPKVTYEMENGEPGILMTKNGKMPDEVLKYIVDRAEAKGYIRVETGVETQAEAVPASQTEQAANQLVSSHELVAANTVSKGESFTQTLNELKKAGVIDIAREDYNSLLRTVGPRLAKIEYPDGTPVAYPNRFPPHDWRLNRSPSGRLHAKAIRLIERVAREHTYGKAA